jgi:predicted oxidoreductase (fatty acid repression mutant protein)
MKKNKNQIGCGYCRHEKSCKDYSNEKNKAKDCFNFVHHELKNVIGSNAFFKSKTKTKFNGKVATVVGYEKQKLVAKSKDNKQNLNKALTYLESKDIDYNSATEIYWMEALKIAAGFGEDEV